MRHLRTAVATLLIAMSTIVPLAQAPPAEALSIRCGATVYSKTSYDYDFFQHFVRDYQDVWRDTIYYNVCSTGWFLRSHRYSLTLQRPGSASCAFGDWQAYKMDATRLGPSDPPGHSWPCVEGKRHYVYWIPVQKILYRSSTDKCWYANWTRAWQGHLDVHGRTNTRCF